MKLIIENSDTPEEVEKISKQLDLNLKKNPGPGNPGHQHVEVKFWKTLFSNKMFSGFFVAIFAALIAWGAWTTAEIFGSKASFAADDVRQEAIQQQLEEVDEDLDEIKVEQRELRSEQKSDTMKILELLLNIQQQLNDGD